MAQLTAEERRRIVLHRQRTAREVLRRLSTPPAASAALRVPGRLGRIVGVTLVAALLSAGWFVSNGVVLHVPASFAELLPRL
jgi:hypothetical protein